MSDRDRLFSTIDDNTTQCFLYTSLQAALRTCAIALCYFATFVKESCDWQRRKRGKRSLRISFQIAIASITADFKLVKYSTLVYKPDKKPF
ncbi:hypothetical protein [uncultured Nostoc sp.]|uniref:hypothetical protein n=1 Tax=uncultured Nostoc sp. TaxID=340711 RepID=UPI0035CB7488